MKTILSSVEPMTDSELKEMERKDRHEWAERALAELLVYADYNHSFAVKICKDVADKFGPNDEMSSIIKNRILAERKNKNRGPRKKWNYIRYLMLLGHYHLFMKGVKRGDGRRKEVLELLAENNGIKGENRVNKIEGRISKAKKIINPTDLAEYF